MSQYFSIIDSQCREFSLIEEAFSRLIAPIYGPQTHALDKIGLGADRICEGLFVDDKLVGMLVYKKHLTNPDMGLEIKTLALLNPGDSSGRGLGTVLFDRAQTVARQRQAERIVLTVSSSKPEALHFFQKKGFEINASINDQYSVGAIEHALSYRLPALQPKPVVTRPALVASADTSRDLIPKRSSAPQSSHVRFDGTHADDRREPKRSRNDFESAGDLRREEGSRRQPNRGFFGNSHPAPRQHKCTLKNQYIQNIVRGQKTYEGRINTGMFKDYHTGDRAIWESHQSSVVTHITDRREYSTFRTMLEDIGYQKMVPEAKSLDHAVSLYNGIPNYAEKARRFGVVALGVAVCEPQVNNEQKQSSTHYAR